MRSCLAVVLTLTTSLALLGCENPCVEICSSQLECDGADPEVDCEQRCADQKTAAEASSCMNEYDDAIDCLGGADDLCALTEDVCKEEVAAHAACLSAYCKSAPDDPACES